MYRGFGLIPHSIFVFILLVGVQSIDHTVADDRNTIDLRELIRLVDSEIAAAESADTGSPLVRIVSVQLTVGVTRVAEADGGAKFKVPLLELSAEGGAGIARQEVELVTLEFTTPDQLAIAAGIQLNLTEDLMQIKEGIRTAADHSQNLIPLGAEIVKKFNLTKTGETGVSIVFVEFDGKIESVQQNTIKLKFAVIE